MGTKMRGWTQEANLIIYPPINSSMNTKIRHNSLSEMKDDKRESSDDDSDIEKTESRRQQRGNKRKRASCLINLYSLL